MNYCEAILAQAGVFDGLAGKDSRTASPERGTHTFGAALSAIPCEMGYSDNRSIAFSRPQIRLPKLENKMRYGLFVLWMLFFPLAPAAAQVNIGINLSLFPELVRVPGYPVYYAPQVNSNYFFYDGMYWIFQGDSWYASSWYNGPWQPVAPYAVPLFILRIPVRYYRQPPVYFRGWRADAPPRWSQHWGNDWARQRSGWDKWNRHAAPAPAPLPMYQRQYSGNRYPRVEQQQALQSQNYHYQPRAGVPVPAQQGQARQEGISRPQEAQHPHATARPAPPDAALQAQQIQRQQQGAARHEQQVQRQQQNAVQHEQQLQRQGAAQHEQQIQRQQQNAVQHEQQVQRQQQGAAQHEQQQVQRQQQAAAQHEQPRPNPPNAREGKGAPPEAGRGQEREKGGEREH